MSLATAFNRLVEVLDLNAEHKREIADLANEAEDVEKVVEKDTEDVKEKAE
jgi:hypothetical protein